MVCLWKCFYFENGHFIENLREPLFQYFSLVWHFGTFNFILWWYQQSSHWFFSQAKIPIDPFWAAAMMATYRALIAIIGSSVNGKYRRRPTYLICCGISIIGQLSLSSYCYFNQDELLTTNFPFAKWIPIFSIMMIYTAFSFGFGAIPFMLQVEF